MRRPPHTTDNMEVVDPARKNTIDRYSDHKKTATTTVHKAGILQSAVTSIYDRGIDHQLRPESFGYEMSKSKRQV
jgi:hypothetical protein